MDFTIEGKVLHHFNGQGMSYEVLAKIGERVFSFGKNSTEAGFGLGHFHASEVIKAFHGSMKIYSQLNFGTQIEIKIP